MFGSSLCVLQSISYSFASTISTCCSAWAWDHECHITAYDLSRQRRRSVILVYIPHEITVQYNYLHRPLYYEVYNCALSNESDYTMMQYVQFRLGLISDYVRLSLAEFKENIPLSSQTMVCANLLLLHLTTTTYILTKNLTFIFICNLLLNCDSIVFSFQRRPLTKNKLFQISKVNGK